MNNHFRAITSPSNEPTISLLALRLPITYDLIYASILKYQGEQGLFAKCEALSNAYGQSCKQSILGDGWSWSAARSFAPAFLFFWMAWCIACEAHSRDVA